MLTVSPLLAGALGGLLGQLVYAALRGVVRATAQLSEEDRAVEKMQLVTRRLHDRAMTTAEEAEVRHAIRLTQGRATPDEAPGFARALAARGARDTNRA
jgi:hypothetical protein